MLEQLTWIPLSKICENSRLILFYNIDPYGQSFFTNCTSVWNGLTKDMAEANTLDIFKFKLQSKLHQCISEHIRQRILLINEPEHTFNYVRD